MVFVRRARRVALTAAALISCGCGGGGDGLDRRPVSGTVIIDGKPIDSALVTFLPVSLEESPTPAATRVVDGAFSIGPEFGLVAGRYKVSISAVKEVRGKRSRKPAAPSDEFDTTPTRESLPARYNAQTQLLADVTDAGPNDFSFLVTSK